MKKLLYTLFAFAIIVACEKDMDDNYNVNSISPIEVTVDSSDAIDAAFEFIGSVEAPKESSSVTSKVGATGTQWIHVIFFAHGGQNLALLRGSTATESCWDNLPGFVRSALYTWNTTTNELTVTVETAAGELPATPRPQSDASAARYDRLFRGTALDRIRVTNDRYTRSITGTPPTDVIDFSCSTGTTDVSGAYGVTRAPFPLTGYLATIDDTFTFISGLDANAANYAGSDERAVRNAIEGDILNMENYVSTTPLTNPQ